MPKGRSITLTIIAAGKFEKLAPEPFTVVADAYMTVEALYAHIADKLNLQRFRLRIGLKKLDEPWRRVQEYGTGNMHITVHVPLDGGGKAPVKKTINKQTEKAASRHKGMVDENETEEESDNENETKNALTIITKLSVNVKATAALITAQPSYAADKDIVNLIKKVMELTNAPTTDSFQKLMMSTPIDGLKRLVGTSKVNRNITIITAGMSRQFFAEELQLVESKKEVLRLVPILLQEVVALLYGMRYIGESGRAGHKQFEMELMTAICESAVSMSRASDLSNRGGGLFRSLLGIVAVSLTAKDAHIFVSDFYTFLCSTSTHFCVAPPHFFV